MRDRPPWVDVAESYEAMSQRAAERWIACAAEAMDQRGRFTVAVSGGSTPRRLYEILASPEDQARMDWTRTDVFWTDERIVPADDPDSNYRLVQTTLLAHVPIPSSNIHRVRTELGAAEAAEAYEREIRACFNIAVAQWPRFDLLILGVGEDGHTASLFPGSPALQERTRIAVATPHGSLPPSVDRVTLTLPVLNAARNAVFLASGAAKARILQGALGGDPTIPAALVRPTDGTLYWLLDTAAAGAGAGR
ncbi:MAG TPA: 6-phosphogluconolactonase [Chloroflexota bacterium]|nr:6-phosphogluconolactonase [Chloroflexota bacterium]